MTKFRPCIDIHNGKVKQIVGATLSDDDSLLKTNFESNKSPAYFAKMYQKDGLTGGHVIMLGKKNTEAAKESLKAYPGGLQVGGGINPDNAVEFLNAGASHVIVTSWIFPENQFDENRLKALTKKIGKKHLVLDLSCKRTATGWNIATNRWQTLTQVSITEDSLAKFATYCDEFLIHAADVEGKQQGMDEPLIDFLAKNSPIPVTYAGGARCLDDLHRCKLLSKAKIDLTIGSALDIFGGKGIKYSECIEFNRK